MSYEDKPNFDQLIERLEALEAKELKVDDLPVKQLQDTLEQNWEPTAGQLLAPPEAVTEVGVYLNGWVAYDSVLYGGARFYKDPFGIVHLQGMVKNGTIGLSILTLPVDYRPKWQSLFDIQSNGALGRLDITPAGDVVCTTGNNAWVSLYGIHFRAEA